MKKLTYTILFLGTLLSTNTFAQPQLVVQLIVDQLRGDLIQKHQSQFGPDGFNYLLNHGLDFHNAHHSHANTTTCAGHTSIATGSYPSLHGIMDNDWYDRKTRKLMYCVEDLNSQILPTNHTKVITPGRSPLTIKQSTLSDELVLAKKGRAFSVSFKDRGAITLAGHAGKAFWFDKKNGGFVTSQFYYKAYPQWVIDWNKQYQAVAFDWNLKRDRSTYQNIHNKPFHHDYQTYGQTFPHHAVNPPSEDYFTALSRTPLGDQLAESFVEQLLKSEKLGQSKQRTDYLSVSFSTVDAIGHQFGPNSLEAEENLLELDETLAKLLKTIDKEVGLKNTLIVLTADHGVSDGPSYLREHHIAEIKPVPIERTSAVIHKLLAKKFNLPKETLMSLNPPFIYLDQEIIKEHNLTQANVSRFLADALTSQPGIFKAYALPITYIEKDWLSAKVDRMSYPYRAGDIYIVQPPYQSYGAKNENRVAHGSPWQYDSYVPLLFVHPDFKPQLINRPVFIVDIAITLANLLNIKAPSGAVGEPLMEVLDAYQQLGKEKPRKGFEFVAK
ncbi:MAG: alkaline phosphatase family protein [Legionella sp.]|nr:MAG: alkaline phosphatase family protein [Legionella sp.]